jgi:hypothetical protein
MARSRQAKTHVRDLPRQILRIGLIPPGGSTPITPVGVPSKPSCRIAGINTSVLRHPPNVLIVGKLGANPMP